MEDDFSNDANTTGILTTDGSVTTGTIEIGGDIDFFALTITSSGTYVINLTGGTLPDTGLALFDENLGLLALNDDRDDSTLDSQIIIELEVGNYFVSAQGIFDDEIGTYQLTASSTAPVIDDFSADINTTGVLPIDGTVATGTLELTGDEDWFELTITENQTLEINLTGDSLADPLLRLYDANGTLLEENDDTNDVDSQITFDFEPGTFFVSAGSFASSLSGSYQLTAEDPAGSTPDMSGEDIQGDDGNNTLLGSALDDKIQGFGGQDVLSGQGGKDTLIGDAARSLSLDSYEGQLFRAFQAVFDRAPDAGGFNTFLTEMRLGNLTQENVIAEFVTSAEFQQTFGALDNQGFVEQLFRNVLDREGDAGGIAAFTASLDSGRERASVVTEFANSAEFFQLMTPPSAAFSTNVIIHPAEAQVFRIYQAVFNRDPDEAGFTAFTNSIQASVLTAEEITAEFVASAEFQLTYGNLENAEFVELLFTNVLPGNMDAQGRADFTEALDAGTLTRAGMVAEFVDSFEFVQRMDAPATEFVAGSFTTNTDILNGGRGDDVYFGGRGADTFFYNTDNSEMDTILDFTPGTDIIDLSGSLNGSFDSLAEILAVATQVGQDSVFDFGDDFVGGRNVLILENVTLSDLTEADFGLSMMG